ncbi:MFS transporter [Flavobacterium sp. MAH-1]|uniref:MFS transporter n=1 Tax=Flavobacterium agri TaxID=2743471 RepID=A0A7Y8Y176_9FLAO|nr:MFS transporter [Flavobacterium agri]NUY80542.1 MFS transporter [Flavobacterium agri]NYA70566.1 MFS transporter [Flavobacterium agri]
MTYSPRTYRITVSTLFFMAGLCFSSWASRIATIQQSLGLNEAGLGAVLFALPVGLMLSLPLSGWAVSKIGSRKVLAASLTLYGLMLVCLGLANSVTLLIVCLIFFGMASNAVNISVNTQAVATENLYPKPIMASFHGLWSLAGFVGAGIGTFMIGNNVATLTHFLIIGGIVLVAVGICWAFLHDDNGKSERGPAFVKPDKFLITLGAIAFCSMIIEGAMFDWSTIYFKKIVGAEKGWIGAGYTAGMCAMASGRFVADWFSHKFGLKRTLQISGLLSLSGCMIAVIFPILIPAMLGFLLIGAGISSVVPMVYSAAGKSETMQPGPAIAAVSTISFTGFLIGPPMIGFIAEASNLKISFLFLAAMAVCVIVFTTRAKI